MLVAVLSVLIKHVYRDHSVEGAGVRDVPQQLKQNICQTICLPDIRADPVFNLISSHFVADIWFRTRRHPFVVYKLFEMRLVML
jgi:hypothetical protein